MPHWMPSRRAMTSSMFMPSTSLPMPFHDKRTRLIVSQITLPFHQVIQTFYIGQRLGIDQSDDILGTGYA